MSHASILASITLEEIEKVQEDNHGHGHTENPENDTAHVCLLLLFLTLNNRSSLIFVPDLLRLGR
ncbi:hypothetical protein CHELA1G11_10562 [Hyphomicrobiales bacterium]|nr:hypothetical protein CHELA1G11_10562 [Hyphomicrobiales bacterium]CAH1673803.1 hypothetical protein CHELA1G2_13741 [Hyphomicrobiales bacterium]